MFSAHKHKVKAAVLAETMVAEFVEKPLYEPRPEMLMSSESRLAFNSKLKLYQFACVLLAILNEERDNPDYSPVREHLETRFFTPTFAQGANMLDEVRGAMRDLAELLTPNDKPRHLSWAGKWLSTVGIDESNPATLHLFALHWTEHFIAINKAVGKFRPIA